MTMKIERKQITIADLIDGYTDSGVSGVTAYGGRLDVRPAYQREYIYGEKERDEVIRSVSKGFPLNVMYWSKVGDRYELMDGQQRTISICRYAAENEQTFSVDMRYWHNLQDDERGSFLAYPLDIYVCDGTPSEVLAWFKVINIAGLRLTEQELRNTSYTGPWLADAKIHFSKPNCAAYNMAHDYVKGSPIRQELLEKALEWIIDLDGLEHIEDYMAIHQDDDNSSHLWVYFQKVIQWTQMIFPTYRSEMKSVQWGLLYNQHKDRTDLDPEKLEAEVSRLMIDDDVTKKAGIYEYLLTRDEKFLNIRTFDKRDSRAAYELQKGVCPYCGQHFEFDEMHADHITPWSKGGRTVPENCQMLCRDCNLKKSND